MPSQWEAEVLEWVPDGVVVVDELGRIVYVNRQTERLTGYRRAELLGQQVELLVPAGLRTVHRRHRRKYASRPTPRLMGKADDEFRLRRKDGSAFVADIAISPTRPPGSGLTVAAIRDATERRTVERELEHKALHDPLTDLPNRTLFFDRLKQAMLGHKRDRQPVALVMLDLDGFKTVNDVFGHTAGDHVLRQLAAQLQAGLRSTDTVARMGGDEFAWILPHVGGPQAAVRKVRSLLRSVARTYSVDGRQIVIGVSAGVSLFPDHGQNSDSLMRHADLALYTAKRQGGGVAYVSQHLPRARARLRETR